MVGRLPPHGSSSRLSAELERLLPHVRAWTGVCYRAADVQWSRSRDLFSGEGARVRGGRWNPPGLAAAYACLWPEVALLERLAWVRRAGIPDADVLPSLIAWAHVRIRRTLDLAHGGHLDRFRALLAGSETSDWRGENTAGRETLTQAVGRVAAGAGIEALLVPSTVVAGAVNLVIFPGCLRRGSELVGHGLEP